MFKKRKKLKITMTTVGTLYRPREIQKPDPSEFAQDFLPDRDALEQLKLTRPDHAPLVMHLFKTRSTPYPDEQGGWTLVCPREPMDELIKPLPDLTDIIPGSFEANRARHVATLRGGQMLSHHLDVSAAFDVAALQVDLTMLRNRFKKNGLALHDLTLKAYPVVIDGKTVDKKILEIRVKSRATELHVWRWLIKNRFVDKCVNVAKYLQDRWDANLTHTERELERLTTDEATAYEDEVANYGLGC
jgi:hypothetical protein